MKDKLYLSKPTKEMESYALAFRKEHFDYGEQIIHGSELFDSIHCYNDWLTSITMNANPETVNKNWVLTDTFFAVSERNHEIVGIIDLRYELHDFLKDFGHCGYNVRPTKRGHGYANQMLSQVCLIAKQHGLKKLQVSVEADNLPSIKTILKNGGEYVRSFTFEGKEADVYIIKLS